MFRWLVSWALYWTGDAMWRLFDRGEGMGWRSYRAYNWCMCMADAVQGDTPNGPWRKAE